MTGRLLGSALQPATGRAADQTKLAGSVALTLGRQPEQRKVLGSDSQCEVGERDTESVSSWLFGSDLVVASPQVLHERVTSRDGGGRAASFEAAHRSKSGLEPTVIGLNRVVRVLPDAVPRVRDQLIQDTL